MSSVEPTAAGTAGPATGARRHLVQLAALTFGVVFVLVGLLGFIPGITTHYGQLTLAGPMSGAMLLGVFGVSVLHNIVHLAFGITGLALARTAAGARNFLIYGGVVYAVLWIYGLAIDQHGSANFVPLNTADNWLHLGLAVAMIGLGVLLGRSAMTRPSTAS